MSQVITVSKANPKVHIQVGSAHPVFGARPWSQQSQGCGKQGDIIHMGGAMLTSANVNSSNIVSMLKRPVRCLLLAFWAGNILL